MEVTGQWWVSGLPGEALITAVTVVSHFSKTWSRSGLTEFQKVFLLCVPLRKTDSLYKSDEKEGEWDPSVS